MSDHASTYTVMANPLGNPNLLPGPGRKRTVGTSDVSILLDRLLTEKGWTLRKLAEEADLIYQNVQAYFSGTKNPTPDTLTKLLAPFGLKAELIPAIIEIREIGTNRLLEVLGTDKFGHNGATEGIEPEDTMADQTHGALTIQIS